MEINEFFGKKISELRKEKGFSQEKLALEANIDRTYISDIEKGNRNISLEILDKLSKALKIHISQIFKDYNG
ncbi:helix-turn-helix transcriptional regulator [Faecalibacter sp. LW9]|uniref:helix-turn-helix domain-containing protein n=1 Tax=Faecalibacter sp. LW9 TaxID=3103144 RepID=UPI002AFF9E2A|nr:helix-turn-helix transcriptional regulator [Faecalibacter sp. LW9]